MAVDWFARRPWLQTTGLEVHVLWQVCHVLRGNIDGNFGDRAAPGRIWVASLS